MPLLHPDDSTVHGVTASLLGLSALGMDEGKGTVLDWPLILVKNMNAKLLHTT